MREERAVDASTRQDGLEKLLELQGRFCHSFLTKVSWVMVIMTVTSRMMVHKHAIANCNCNVLNCSVHVAFASKLLKKINKITITQPAA